MSKIQTVYTPAKTGLGKTNVKLSYIENKTHG